MDFFFHDEIAYNFLKLCPHSRSGDCCHWQQNTAVHSFRTLSLMKHLALTRPIAAPSVTAVAHDLWDRATLWGLSVQCRGPEKCDNYCKLCDYCFSCIEFCNSC
jgi:hypothetical protein